MPTTPQVVVATTSGLFFKSASLDDSTDKGYATGERLSVVSSHEVDGVTLLEVSRTMSPGERLFIPAGDTGPLAADAGPEPSPMARIPIRVFINALLESCRQTGSNPGMLLAVAWAESGANWAETEKPSATNTDPWDKAEILPGTVPEHGGVGPFQFRPEMWTTLVKAFPVSLEAGDRLSAAGQAQAAALMEQQFAQAMSNSFTTMDFYLEFIFGPAAAKAIREAAAGAKLSDLLTAAFKSNPAALETEKKWRADLLMEGGAVRSLDSFKAAVIAKLDVALATARAIFVANGVEKALPKPVPEGKDAAIKPVKAVGSGNPKTRVRRDLVVIKRSPGYLNPKGYLVEILQKALKEWGLYFGTTDGDYGAASAEAVRMWQLKQQVKADGQCRASDWEGITGLQAPSLYDRCLHLAASFEGTGFTKVEGNFDGALMTWGIVGFTLKHDLPGLMRDIDKDVPGALEECFGDERAAKLREMVKSTTSEGTRAAWVSTISVSKMRLTDAWTEGFKKLGSRPEVQEIQIRRAQTQYWSAGVCTIPSALKYDAADALDIALLFDASIQNGGISVDSGRAAGFAGLDKTLRGSARRKRWADIVAAAAIPKWQSDVRSRKMMFANGEGVVHGSKYKLEDWGLTEEPVTAEQLTILRNEVDIAFMPASFGVSVPERKAEVVAEAGGLPWIETAYGLIGTKEAKGSASNQSIIAWAKGIGLKSYSGDDIPWCGLFVAHCLAINGIASISAPLVARNWENFSDALDKPAIGCIMVFWRESKSSGKGHVGFYVSEDKDSYHILGGNQSDQVCISKCAKSQFLQARWPSSQKHLFKDRISYREFDGKVLTSAQQA